MALGQQKKIFTWKVDGHLKWGGTVGLYGKGLL